MLAGFPPLDLGALPIRFVNAALGTDLKPGTVRLSAIAHRHMAKDHAADYPVCIAALRDAIARPTFIGQGPGHTENFEMIRLIARPDGKAVLVAIGLALDPSRNYRVRSCYLISAQKVDRRRREGRLIASLDL